MPVSETENFKFPDSPADLVFSILLRIRYLHVDGNLALLGEFNRVVDQVDEHLPQPQRITNQIVRNSRVHRKYKPQLLLCRLFAHNIANVSPTPHPEKM